MASFFSEIGRNRLKSILLMAVFSLFFMGIIYLLVWYLGAGLLGLAIGAILVAAYALLSYHFGSRFVLRMSGAKPADRKQYPFLFDTVEGLASASQVPVPAIYVINDPSPNAFATGNSKRHASIAVTTGLLQMMDKEELQGVVAHEMSHIGNNDIQFMLMAVVFAGVIGIAAAFLRGMFWFGGRGRNGGIIALVALAIGLLAPLFAMLLRLAISRRREYMADANGGRLTRDPKSLADALKKIKNYAVSPKTSPVAHANEMTASLYFANPFKAQSLMNLFSTHPPIDDRIARLEKMY